MRQYKLLEIQSQYDRYLSAFYHAHSDIDRLSYNELLSMLNNDCFAQADFVQFHLKNLGIESKIIFYNNRNLQNKWDPERKDMSYFDIILSQIREFSPDIILISNVRGFTKEQTAMIKDSMPNKEKKLVGYHFTLLDDAFKQNVPLYDQIYTGSKYFVNLMKDLGIPAFLLRHAFEPRILDRLPKVERTNAVCFVGSIIRGKDVHDNRLDMLNALIMSNVPYTFYGNIYGQTKPDPAIESSKEERKYFKIINDIDKDKKSDVYGVDYYSTLNQYNICLNLHSSSAGNGTGNMRMYEATGIGTCLLTDYRDENSELFDVDNEIVVYESFEDMVEKAKWLLNNPERAAQIALAGQKRTLQEYTYKHKAEQLNEYIQALLR